MGAEHRLLEGEVEAQLHVGASQGTAPLGGLGAAAERAAAAEEGLEDVAQAAGPEAGERVRRIRRRAGAPHRVGAEHVVAAPALRVPQRLVGEGDQLEAVLGLLVARLGVRVQLAGELAVGPLDLGLGRAVAYPQQLVEVGVCVGHPGYPSVRCRPRRWLTTATAASACG